MKTVNRILLGVVTTVAVAGGAAYLFREPLMSAASAVLTRDMFVAADEDAFDPGVAEGESFPEIEALHEGRVVRDVRELAGPNGLVFLAVRSADW